MSLRFRRGGYSAEEPPSPPGTLYGPTLGAQTVRDGTIPRAVTDPGGSRTLVNPGDSISSKITTAGTNGTLYFMAGTHSISSTLSPLAGQTWYFQSAAGYTRTAANSAILTGNDTMTTALLLGQQALTIRGGVFTGVGGAGAATFVGALQNTAGAAMPAAGWVIEDAIVTANDTVVGMKLCGPNATARRCYVHANGRYGLNAVGLSAVHQVGLTFENCRIANNNTTQEDPTWDSGGTKFLAQNLTVIRSCWFQSNFGSGIWFDGPNINATIEENVIENNRNWGFFWEISSGGTTVQHNLFAGNGEASSGSSAYNDPQVLVSTTDATRSLKGVAPTFNSVEIQNNIFTGSEMAMYLVDTSGHIGGNPGTRNIHFHDNDVTFTSTSTNRVGATTNTGVNDIFTSGNTWENNHYHASDTSLNFFNWSGGSPGTGVTKNFTQWQAFGHDNAGSID